MFQGEPGDPETGAKGRTGTPPAPAATAPDCHTEDGRQGSEVCSRLRGWARALRPRGSLPPGPGESSGTAVSSPPSPMTVRCETKAAGPPGHVPALPAPCTGVGSWERFLAPRGHRSSPPPTRPAPRPLGSPAGHCTCVSHGTPTVSLSPRHTGRGRRPRRLPASAALGTSRVAGGQPESHSPRETSPCSFLFTRKP